MDKNRKSPKELYSELKDLYPYNHGVMGYKPSLISTVLAVLTYIVTFGQYSPSVIGSLLYFIPLLLVSAIVIPILFEDEKQDSEKLDDLKNSSVYLLFVLFVTFVLYFGYSSLTGFTTTLVQVAGNNTLFNISASIVKILIGIPVTASFYYTLYTYYNVFVESVELMSSETDG